MYSIKEFLEQCNKTPLLKNYRKRNDITITETTLVENDFLKDIYTLGDLSTIAEILTSFIPPEEPPEPKIVQQKKRRAKDLAHLKLIMLLDNQNLVSRCRKELGMPFPNRGFKIIKNARPPLAEMAENFNNTNFDFSPEFEKWFFGEAGGISQKISFELWEKTSNDVFNKVEGAVKIILTKWRLPPRYTNAIRELILFNRIIPAASGIHWTSRPDIDGIWRDGIEYDADITTSDLIETIKEDLYKIFRKRKRDSTGKNRRSTRSDPAETAKMIAEYNKHRKDGKKNKEIFKILKRKYNLKLTISGIRKRIKGK